MSKKSPRTSETEVEEGRKPSTGRRATQAAPYAHGKGYAIRRRYKGHDIFLSGFPTAAAANRAMTQRVRAIDDNERPAGAGAQRTTLAQAMQDYALARLPFLKGAPQESRRINNYLRAAGLRLLVVRKLTAEDRVALKRGKGAYYEVELVPHTTERVIPQGLGAHRKALLNANARTDKHRAVLASTPMSEVTRDQVQALMDMMTKDENAASTVDLERAMLRVIFNYAYTTWRWTELRDNPATRLNMPKIDNERNRILSEEEQVLLDEALSTCRNSMAAPTLVLLRETAMRASEPIEQAVWGDVDWTRKVMKLRDSKAGKRDVPLSPAALDALRALEPGEPHERVVRISYEALRAAWRRACERAGIEGLHIHDLRHTAATRTALKYGNVFLVKALTGHKTLKMLERYVNVGADDVVKVMHASAEPVRVPEVVPVEAKTSAPQGDTLPSNVIMLTRRRTA